MGQRQMSWQTSGRQRRFGAACLTGESWHRKGPTLARAPSSALWGLRRLRRGEERRMIVCRAQRSFMPLRGRELRGDRPWGDLVLAGLSSIAGA